MPPKRKSEAIIKVDDGEKIFYSILKKNCYSEHSKYQHIVYRFYSLNCVWMIFFLFTVGMEVDAVSDSGSEGESLVCVKVGGRERFDNLSESDDVMIKFI